jgi:membrane fusion protein, multidrug efflux system
MSEQSVSELLQREPDSSPRPVWRRPAVLFIAVCLGFAGVTATRPYWPEPRVTLKPVPAIPRVSVTTAVRGDIPVVLRGLGVVTPVATVSVRVKVSGELKSVGFTEGQMVKAGDLLATVDPAPYQITSDEARANLMREKALLDRGRATLARYESLVSRNDISRQVYDDQVALVRQAEALVQVDQARLNRAELDLSYCTVTAPIDGRAGLRLVDVGNFVRAGEASPVVTITRLRPISVLFSLPQDDVPAVLRRMKDGVVMPVAVYDRTDTTLLETGSLGSIDNAVDSASGTVRLRAIFMNEAEALFANQFVNARLTVDTLRDVVTVPEEAVREGPDSRLAWVVDEQHRARLRRVSTGTAVDGRIAVLAGLEAGARVIIDGADQLREGALVAVAREARQ